MATMGNRMRVDSDTDEKDDLLRRAGAMDVPDDEKNHLRADILGSIAGSSPNDVGYLGRIDNLLTAHGALEKPQPFEPGSRAYDLAVGATSQPRMRPPITTMAEPPNLDKTPNAMMGRPTLGPERDTSSDLIPTRMGQQPKPGLLGRIGHVVTRMGDIAGTALAPGVMMNIPGTMLNKRMEANRAEAQREWQEKIGIDQTRASAEQSRADTEAKKEAFTESKPKLLSGEENVRTDQAGNRERAYELPNGSIEWRPEGAAAPARLPSVGGEPTPQYIYGKPKTGTDEEQFVQKYLADNKLPDTAENRLAGATAYKSGAAIGDNDAKQLTTQIANALKGTGIDPSGYAVTAKSTRGEANEALKAAQAAANEQRTRTAPEAAQNRKDAHTMGYALSADGKLVYTNKAEADKRGVTFEEMKPDAVNKDRQSLRQLNDIQKNISEYRKAIDAFQGPIENTAAMRRIMAGVNSSDVEKMGYLTMGAAMNMLEHGEVSKAWNELNGEEKAAMIGYLRAKGAMIAYNRVVSGSARTNKEALEVEWANLPSPDVGATAADKQMDAMQQNLDQVNAGYPTNLPGMRVPEKVKEGVEGGAHNFSVNGVEYRNVTDEDYARAKKLKGFKE